MASRPCPSWVSSPSSLDAKGRVSFVARRAVCCRPWCQMSIDLIVGSAGQADAWLRRQIARIEQRHLQSGRHCRLDLAGLLKRAARQSGAAALAQFVAGREDLATDQYSKVETATQETSSKADHTAHAHARSLSGIVGPTGPNGRRVRGPATLGDFVARNRPDAGALREWIATLADLTTVVVSDRCDLPSSVHIERVVSIVIEMRLRRGSRCICRRRRRMAARRQIDDD